MSAFGTSIAVKLKADPADAKKVVIDTQEASLTKGVINEVTGIFDGGLSTSVGLSHTLGVGLKVAAGMQAQRSLLGAPGLIFSNGLRG
jgi:hypothetical protein